MNDLNPLTPIFLRYCGCTASSAWQRHHEDLHTSRRNSEFLHILHTIKLLYPEIIDEVNIYEFVTGTIPVSLPGSNEVRDLREEGLIALFGLETLLNTQSGGKFPSTEPSSELEQEFSSLNLSTLTRLSAQTEPCHPEVVQEINKYIKNVQQYANEHPESTGTYASPFTDERCTLLLPQLTPHTLKGTSYTLMAFVGHDPTVRDFQAGIPFYEGDSFFKESLLSMIRFLCRTEDRDYQSIPKKLVSQGYLPLIDFYPWCKKSSEDLPLVMTESRRYLQAINPVILVTFGQQVSSVASGNFLHTHGLKAGDLGNVVGDPIIRYYCEPDASDEIHDDSCVIVVPCYHPGAGLYGVTSGPNFVEIMARTMIVAWTAMFFALKLPKEDVTKYELLQRVIKATNKAIGGTSSFATKFAAARDRLRTLSLEKRQATQRQPAIQKTTRGVPSTKIKDVDRPWGAVVERHPDEQLHSGDPAVIAMVERWEAAREELEMIMLCGWAIHPPASLEANVQAHTLISNGVAALRTEKTGSQGSLWKWARSVDQGRFYYLEGASITDEVRDIPNLLAIFAATSTDVEDPAWIEDEQILDNASKALRAWLYEKVKQSTTTLDTAVSRGNEALAALMFLKDPELAAIQQVIVRREMQQAPKVYSDPTQSLEGCEVDVVSRAKGKTPGAILKLNWSDKVGKMWQLGEYGSDQAEIVLPPKCMMISRKDRRHIHFVEEGIDIRTSEGVTLKPDGTSCTIPLGHIRLMLKGEIRDKLIELWSKETGLDAEDAEFNVRPTSDSQHNSKFTGQYYPAEVFRPSSRARENQELNVGARGRNISAPTEEKKIKSYLPLQAGDAMWLLHKFLQEQYPGVCKLDVGNPNIIPGTDSMWARLQAFVDTPKYAHHPMRQHLKDIATTALLPTNTGGCDQMLKLAIEKFLRPGTTSKRFRVYVAPKQKWKAVYDLSANPPSLTTLPSSVNPKLHYDEVLESAENDERIGPDGELMDAAIETEEDQGSQEEAGSINEQVTESIPSSPPGQATHEQEVGTQERSSKPLQSIPEETDDTTMADTPSDTDTAQVTHPASNIGTPGKRFTPSLVSSSQRPRREQPASSYSTIPALRSSSPEIPDGVLTKRKRQSGTAEGEASDDDSDGEWDASKRRKL